MTRPVVEQVAAATRRMRTGSALRVWLSPAAAPAFAHLWSELFADAETRGDLLLCSVGAGAGASTLAAGLAVSGAEPLGDARVALVDAHLRRPALHRMLGVAKGPGLADVLAERTVPELTARAVNAGLDLYPAGQGARDARSLLFSDRLPWLLRQLRQGYDSLILDAGPLDRTPDAPLLIRQVPRVLLVARRRTRAARIARLRRRIAAAGGRAVGVVFNRPAPRPVRRLRRLLGGW